MTPTLGSGDRYLAGTKIFGVFPVPPTVDTHDEVIDINPCLSIQSIFVGQVYKNGDADDTKGINQDFFLFTEPNAQNATDNCDKFRD